MLEIKTLAKAIIGTVIFCALFFLIMFIENWGIINYPRATTAIFASVTFLMMVFISYKVMEGGK